MLRNLIRFGLAGVFSMGIGATALAADQPMQDTDKPAEQGQAAQEKAAREKAAADKAAQDKAAADEAAKQGADKAKQGADKASDTPKVEPFEGAVRPAD